MVAGKVAKWKLGDNQHTEGSANLPTQAEADEKLNVSERSIRDAVKLLETDKDGEQVYAPELIRAVEQGKPRRRGRLRGG
jgi:hypothetical protein